MSSPEQDVLKDESEATEWWAAESVCCYSRSTFVAACFRGTR
jgi:hypothetical protein